MRQLILDVMPESAPSLDNFVVGGNGEALTGLAAWLSADNRESSLFFCGDVGVGKTHLLLACSARYSDGAADPDLDGLGAAIETPLAEGVFAVDHVDALSAHGQIVLFNAFNRLRAADGRLLTAASAPPLQLTLREDLRTRLGSGLIYRLNSLTDDEKMDALTGHARARGLRLPSEVLAYLLARAPRDMRSLTALLSALDRYSLEHKRPITLPLLREVLHIPLGV